MMMVTAPCGRGYPKKRDEKTNLYEHVLLIEPQVRFPGNAGASLGVRGIWIRS
jgi:hypothetical protein